MPWQCLLLRVIQTEYAHCEPFSFDPSATNAGSKSRSAAVPCALSFRSQALQDRAVNRRSFITLLFGDRRRGVTGGDV